MRIAVAGISFTASHAPLVRDFLDSLILEGDVLFAAENIWDKLCRDLSIGKKVSRFDPEVSRKEIDLYLCIGGDGTMLNAISTVHDSGVPILGINTGRLGYLTSVSLQESAAAVRKFREKHFFIDKRSLLRVETKGNLFGETNYALNDFTIYKNDSASMITIHAYINGVLLNSYWGDGLIISTPTGSTAYNLSCGGPIVSGECGVFVIAPIAPHNLNVRPLVVSDDITISLSAESRQNYYLATLDSRPVKVDSDIEFIVSREKFCINLVQFSEQNFPSKIRSKLNWGIDQRN